MSAMVDTRADVHDDDDETWVLELEEELLNGHDNNHIDATSSSSNSSAIPSESVNQHEPPTPTETSTTPAKVRSTLSSEMPQEVLVNIVGFTPVGRLSKAWSLATSTLARRKFTARLSEMLLSFTDDAFEIAQEVENALFAAYGQSFYLPKSYAQKARQLLFNLKDPRNAALRTRLFTGDLPVATLVRMSASDMANPQLVQQREQWIKKRTHEVMRDSRAIDGFTQTDQFECRMCGSFHTCYRQYRRKAIVDRTRVIVICRDCPYRWEL